MRTPIVFCATCGRYLGAAERCVFCGWERPAALRTPTAGEPLWRLHTVAAAAGHPLVLGDLVCLADRAGALAAISAADGTVHWRWAGEGPLRGALAGRGDRVYAAPREGELVSLDLSSHSALPQVDRPRVRWRFPVPSPGAPTLDDGRIYLGSGEGAVYSLADTGDRPELAWQTRVGGRVALTPVRWRHLLLVATSHAQGQLVALDAGRGTVVWAQPLGARAAILLLASPARTGSGAEALTLTDRGLARLFRLPDGEPRAWSFQVAGGAPVAAAGDDGMLYLGGAGGVVVALDPTTGATRWQANLPDAVIGLVAAEGLALAATRGGHLHVLDVVDGAAHGLCSARVPLTAGPEVLAGTILVGAEAGWSALPWHLGRWDWAAARSGRGASWMRPPPVTRWRTSWTQPSKPGLPPARRNALPGCGRPWAMTAAPPWRFGGRPMWNDLDSPPWPPLISTWPRTAWRRATRRQMPLPVAGWPATWAASRTCAWPSPTCRPGRRASQ